MRRPIFFAVSLIIALLLNGTHLVIVKTSSLPPASVLEGAFVQNEILIGLKPDAAAQVAAHASNTDSAAIASFGIASLDWLNRQYAVQTIVPLFNEIKATDETAMQYGLKGIFKLVVPPGIDIFSMMADYRNHPAIEYAEPNRIYRITDIPNDSDFRQQWGLHNTGQTGGRPDADIDAPEAWDITQGLPTVLIAIIDTGVDYTHPDLAGGRVRTDIDRDFVNNDHNAMDDHGHGTFVAGIAAANTHNGAGIAGVCRGCQILPVKVLDNQGGGTAEWVAQGIQYAAQSGAKIISMSLGMPSNCGCSQTLARAINYAFESGSLLIAASGNDSDKQRTSYPASSPRVMAVGASDKYDREANFSNRDSYLDIVAPGKDIYSLNLNNSYRTADGTSAAAPFVAGVAGLIQSANPQLNNVQLWWRLYQSADDFPPPQGATQTTEAVPAPDAMLDADRFVMRLYLPSIVRTRITAGRLNAEKALLFATPGQMVVPLDTCSGEPTNCTPGCGAEVALSSSASSWHDLQVLRRFRDEQLAATLSGQHWIAVYERHRLELAMLLANDPQLRAQVRLALHLWLPLVRELVEPPSNESALIQAEHVQVARAILAAMSAHGSEELRRDVETVALMVDLAETYVGRDVNEFWRAVIAAP